MTGAPPPDYSDIPNTQSRSELQDDVKTIRSDLDTMKGGLRIIRFIIGIGAGAFLAFNGYLVKSAISTETRVDAMEARMADDRDLTERVAVIETELRSLNMSIGRIERAVLPPRSPDE